MLVYYCTCVSFPIRRDWTSWAATVKGWHSGQWLSSHRVGGTMARRLSELWWSHPVQLKDALVGEFSHGPKSGLEQIVQNHVYFLPWCYLTCLFESEHLKHIVMTWWNIQREREMIYNYIYMYLYFLFAKSRPLRSCPESRMRHCWLWFLGQGSFWIRGSSEARKYSVTVQVQHISKIPVFHLYMVVLFECIKAFIHYWNILRLQTQSWTWLTEADRVQRLMVSEANITFFGLPCLSWAQWHGLGFWATAPVRSTPSLATLTQRYVM